MILSISTRWKLLLVLLNIIILNEGMAQSTQVLPGNGKYSSSSAPQGALRYQRQFYLIDSTEINRSGISSGLIINAIGFKYAVGQDIKSKGQLKVYLQNTSDTYSKSDTAWTQVSNVSGTYKLNGVSPGGYEWQVAANCSAASEFSSIAGFSINNEACKSPTHFKTDSIGSTTAKFTWLKPANAVDSFIVEWSEIGTSAWQRDTTTNTYYHATGLSPDKTYKWKVTSKCSRVRDVETGVFTTSSVIGSCTAPTLPVAGAKTDSTVVLSWTAATGAVQYDVWYRRTGTAAWNQTFSAVDSIRVSGLDRGTVYEWKLRTVCGTLQYGSFVSAAKFTTTGTLQCYAPENLYADSATSNSVKLSWDTIPGATSYTLKYRKRESITWSNAIVPMSLVKDSLLELPDTSGLYSIPFNYNTSFTYTGKGVYVAIEYANAADTLSTTNVALANFQRRYFKDVQGEDSASLLISFQMSSALALPSVLSSSFLRPETWFGAAGFTDSAEVLAVYAMGNNALPYGNPTGISALVRNYTQSDKAYAVSLRINDASNTEVYTEVKNVTVTKDSILLIQFGNWTATAEGKYSFHVSIPGQPGENVLTNNHNAYQQNVTSSIQSYADGSDVTSFTGMDTAKGLLLARYKMNGCGAVNSVQVYLGPTAVGHPLYAVIMNAAGTIIDSSVFITPGESSVNRYQSFYFPAPVAITNGADFYIGLAQPDSSGGYAPVGVQYENGYTRPGAYYRAKIDGTELKDTLAAGRLMIRAEFVAGEISPAITGNLVLCPGGTGNTLTAASITRRFANSVVAFSSEGAATQFTAAAVLGTPDVYPQYGFNENAWMGASAEHEFLVLKFPTPDSINYIDIYQTNNPGAIDTVFVKNASTGALDTLYTGAATALDATSQVKRISFPLTQYKVEEIRISLNGTASGGYNGIDAVSIGRLVTSPGFSSYAWSKKTSSGSTALGSGSTIQVTTAGEYVLTVTSQGCTASASTMVTAQDQTLPLIMANGPLRFCLGDSITLRSNKNGGNTWSTGATTNQIVVKSTGSYSVTHNDGTGCASLTSANTAVTVNTFPVVTISGNLGICPDTTTTLTAAATGPSVYTYLWSNGTATTTNMISGAGSQSVTATDTVGCATTQTAVTIMSPKPVPDITGLLNFCPGGSTSLATATFTSYAWSTGSTAGNITVNTTGKYLITVRNAFGCKGSDSVIVGQFIPPAPVITGSLSICGGSTTLNAGGGFVNYLWSSGQATQTIKVTEPGTSVVTVTDYNGCTGSASATTSNASLPPTPGVITSALVSICNAPENTYTITAVPTATHYVWFIPEGTTIVSGQGTTTLKLAFNAGFISGDIIVAASNACGQSGSLYPRIFPVNAIPSTPGNITGPTSGACSGAKTYSILAVPGATSYAWVVPAGATITAGQNTSSITVNFTSTFTSGRICVRAVNACGSSSERCLGVEGLPNKPGAITGLSSVCYKKSNVQYSISTIPGATYLWTVPAQASITSGQGTASIFVKFGNTSGNVSVRVSNACGSQPIVSKYVTLNNCNGGTTNKEVITSKPVHDVLSPAGNVSRTNSIQIDWTMGEPLIETMKSGKGMYTLGFHQPIRFISRESIVKAEIKITAAPNPVSTKLKVKITAEKEERLMLTVLDAAGRIVFNQSVLSSDKGIEINMSNFSQGIYVLNVHTLSGILLENFKIVKVR